MGVKKSERCDYCNRKRKYAIYVCIDHLTVLDKVCSRREDHPIGGKKKK